MIIECHRQLANEKYVTFAVCIAANDPHFANLEEPAICTILGLF